MKALFILYTALLASALAGNKTVFHMIPHSHMDAGWLLTMEEYYRDHVKYIFTGVVTALQVGKGA
jgi:hypothetical protein